MADIMQELALIRQRLHLIKLALAENNPMLSPGIVTPPFDWKQFIKAFFDKI
jgi:hypothetical protein